MYVEYFNQIYELAFCVVLVLLALFCRKMFRTMYAKLRGKEREV